MDDSAKYLRAKKRVDNLKSFYGSLVAYCIIIPFLIFIFENKEILDRNSLLVLLASIAAGNSYHEVHSKIKITSPFTGKTVEPPENLENLLEKEKEIVTEVQKMCLPLLDTFISNLNNSEPSVRESVAQALAKYPVIKDKSLPALEAQLQKENNPDVVHCLEESIQELNIV